MSAAPAIAAPRTSTWRELAARGARITIAPSTLVTIQAPADVAADLRAALAWRIEVMRAQLRQRGALGGEHQTPIAVPGLSLPLAAKITWHGQVEQYGRLKWVKREAQRPEPGLCASCGESQGHETGDCLLCAAARVATLRGEGVLGAPSTWIAPPPRDVAAWRAGLYAEIARADTLPAPAPRPAWTCGVCGQEQRGHRDEGCGRCEIKAADSISTAKLGGSDEHDEEAFE